MSRKRVVAASLMFVALIGPGCSAQETTPPAPTSRPTSTPRPSLPEPTATVRTDESTVPWTLISQQAILAYIEDLTGIQAYSGWRNSATEGEAEAIEYTAETLGEFTYLQSLGL